MGRLIPFSKGTGAWNMSVDQALLESVDSTQEAVLRFYQWSQPTLSLGYFQSLGLRGQHHASHSADCVRRSTGGGAIMHDCDLTYSLVMPMRLSHAGARLSLYQDVHQAISDSLNEWGVRAIPYRLDQGWSGNDEAFLCFQRRTDEDLVVSGYKVLGSAQRRSRTAVLQHGSLLMQASRFAPELPGVSDLSSGIVGFSDLIDLLQSQLSKQLGEKWSESGLSDDEVCRAQAIKAGRYGSVTWLERR